MYVFVKFRLASSVKATSIALRSILIQRMESLHFQVVWWNRLFRYFYTKTVSTGNRSFLGGIPTPPPYGRALLAIYTRWLEWSPLSETITAVNCVTINILNIESSGTALGEHSWNTFVISIDAEWLIWCFPNSCWGWDLGFWDHRSSKETHC